MTQDVLLKESQVQIALVKWAWHTHGLTLVHTKNEGQRSIGQRIFDKLMGVRKGFPDLALHKAVGGYHGMFIELKRDAKSKVTPEQYEWIDSLTEAGYCAYICRGLETAQDCIESYLALQ